MVPITSGNQRLNRKFSTGIVRASTNSWPSSTPTLKDRSEVSRWAPANCNDSESANEKPNPWISPNPKAIIQRLCNFAPIIFSNAMKTIESAISVSISGGNQRTLGASPRAEAINVIECAIVKEVTIGTNAQKLLNGTTRQNRKSRWSIPSRM